MEDLLTGLIERMESRRIKLTSIVWTLCIGNRCYLLSKKHTNIQNKYEDLELFVHIQVANIT